MNKQELLDKIAREIEKCRLCHIGTSGKPVPGEGNPDADIVFMGEAPGREEAKTGRPFVGRSGKLLRSMIKEIGLNEKDVFITSPVKLLPNRGTPTKDDIKHGITHTDKQLSVIDPKIIVLLGKTAYYAFFQGSMPILKDHGKIFEKDNRRFMATIHPAAVLRFPKFREILVSDFQKLKKIIG